ncbi:MAG TPA: N,N-dimethylformamidase, partial [Planctomycetaceae bacterium]|nr:N,N-dimethylformamidase [Planctomycetaceae bacterium]
MLIGYVSDERYVAQPDVLFEFRNTTGIIATTRSTASGAIIVDVPDGNYEVVLHKPGFGNKITSIE